MTAVKRLVRLFVVAAIAVAGLAFGSSQAMASANGCTTAPGSYGAHTCISTSGSSWTVSQSTSAYYFALPPVLTFPNTCNRKHQWLYTTMNGQVGSYNINPSGCVNALAVYTVGDYATWSPNSQFKSGFCERVANTSTSNSWSSYACVTMKG
jgi:hypothetical protein